MDELERTSKRLEQIEVASNNIAGMATFVQETAEQLRNDVDLLKDEKDIIVKQQNIQDKRLDLLEDQ